MQSQLSVQPLTAFIRSHIAKRGPVTVARFMEWALYHPLYGYYMTGPNIGPRGDFTTSPEASPVFGKLLARHIVEVDALLEHPTTFDIVEFGPGRGTLAGQLMDELHSLYPDIYSRSRYWLVEISPALREAQQVRLSTRHAAIGKWVGSVREMPAHINGVILANEFIDAFPVHVVQGLDGQLFEEYVENSDEGGFKLCPGALSRPDLEAFVSTSGISINDGERIEVNLAAKVWIAELASKLKCGVALIIDYGDTMPGRYSEARRQGTLLGYSGGTVTHDITARPGSQDLTALVDFTALARDAKESGFVDVSLTRQAHFLLGLGLGTLETVESVSKDAKDVAAIIEYRRGIQALVSMEGLGRFHVSVLAKGLDADLVKAQLSGLKYAEFS